MSLNPEGKILVDVLEEVVFELGKFVRFPVLRIRPGVYAGYRKNYNHPTKGIVSGINISQFEIEIPEDQIDRKKILIY